MTRTIDIKRFEQLKAECELPSPRGIALAIIRLTQSDDVSMGELARVIKGDPAFVGRLIKAANGIVSEARRAVVSVQEALMVLGLPAVRTMALGFSLLSNYRKGACTGFDYERFWSSSLVMALSMQSLAPRTRVLAADDAFSLGLLARIGELALATVYPNEYARILAEVKRSPELRQVELEEDAFAMTHRELGAAMLADWGVPEILTAPVRQYEQGDLSGLAEGSREAGLVQCLVLSRAIAQLCLAPEDEHVALMGPMFRLSARLGLPREDFVAVCERVGREWVEWGRLLQFETNGAPRFDRLAEGAEQVPKPRRGGDGEAAEEAVAGAGDAAGPMRVLVLERAVDARARLRTVLEEMGFQVYEAQDSATAVEAAVDIQPRMMLVDWTPGAGGATVLRALRETRIGRGIYVMALLPHEDDTLIAQASEAGADDFLARPLRRRMLEFRLRAGRRTVALQEDLEREREELRRFAAELSISNRRLQEAVMTDALTGFPNRRYAIERMQTEWASATRHHRPLSAMIVDIDGFKLINDTYGHDVGDMALRQSADALRAALRAQDVICRTGGDEFLVICPDTDLTAALRCAERLRLAAETLVIETGGPKLGLTISVGVATRDASMLNIDALIKCADQGSYIAKQLGRNRVATQQAGVVRG